MLPDWVIHKLDVSALKDLAAQYRALAHYLENRADSLAPAEAVAQARRKAAVTRKLAKLTEAQRLARLVAEGRSNAEIGVKFGISERTVQRRLRRLVKA